ncbi:MAG: N-acetyltransferase family protein [Pseudomonadota bacterium]
MIIRDTVAGDITAITEIYADAVLNDTASFELHPPSPEEMLARFEAIKSRGCPYLVATEGSRILGYAYASAYRERPAYRWTVENSVYLTPNARGRGIGSALTSEVIRHCKVLGFRQMIAVIGGKEHTSSIRMHAKLGFEHAGTLEATGFKHGKWLASVLMQKSLGEGETTSPDANRFPGTLYRVN